MIVQSNLFANKYLDDLVDINEEIVIDADFETSHK